MTIGRLGPIFTVIRHLPNDTVKVLQVGRSWGPRVKAVGQVG